MNAVKSIKSNSFLPQSTIIKWMMAEYPWTNQKVSIYGRITKCLSQNLNFFESENFPKDFPVTFSYVNNIESIYPPSNIGKSTFLQKNIPYFVQFWIDNFLFSTKEQILFNAMFLDQLSRKTIHYRYGYGYSRYSSWRISNTIIDRMNTWTMKKMNYSTLYNSDSDQQIMNPNESAQ